MRYPRILFYAVNGLGLGHVTRLLAIARKVREIEPHSEIVFLTSSEADNVIFREGFAAFKTPSKNIRGSSGVRPVTYARMIQTVTLNLIASFHPHLLVVDTFPAGMMQELLPCLRWDLRKVFVYREQRTTISSDPLFQNTLKLYDLFIVPHYKGEAEVILPEGATALWSGPIIIRDSSEALSRTVASQQMGVPPDIPLIYVSFGGGGDPEAESIRETVISTLAGISTPRGNLYLALATGPLHRGAIPRGDYLIPVYYYPIAEMYPAFDAAIAAAGYNTVMELLHHQIPAIYIPFARQVDDQEARANWVAEQNAGYTLDVNDKTALIDATLRILDPEIAQNMRHNAGRLAPENGAQCAAEAIIKLLE